MPGPNNLRPVDLEREQPRSEEVELHHQSLELPSTPLYDRSEAIGRYGINGDIQAIVKLPSTEPGRTKDLAIVDFGEVDADNPTALFGDQEGKLYPHLGRTRSRYGLVGLYSPNSHTIAYSQLAMGETPIGRNTARHNYLLGLAPGEPNLGAISKQHLSVQLNEEGCVKISDYSTNATVVEIPKTIDQSTGDLSRPELAEGATDRLLAFIPEEHQEAAAKMIAGREWQKLVPNYEHDSNMDPRDVTPEMLGAVVAALHTEEVARNGSWEVGVFGYLTPSGEGDSKQGFVFTDQNGRKLHILLDEGYRMSPQIQQDPRIYMRSRDTSSQGYTTEHGAYSNARTYVSLPLRTTNEGDMLGVHFQEYVGEAAQGRLMGMKKALAGSQAKRYIQDHGLEIPNPHDFDKGEHYLTAADGSIAIIDIDVMHKVPYAKNGGNVDKPKGLDMLESAKTIFSSATGNDWILGKVPGLDTLLNLMKPEERRAFEAWQLEQAAVRTPSLWEVLEKSAKDEGGTHVVPEQLTEDFEKALEAYGAHREPPSEMVIEAGVAQAKRLVDSDRATPVLKNEEFMDHYELKSLMRNAKKVTANFREPMFIDPNLIRGAGGFDSWAGRGHNGWGDKAYTKANGQHVTGASIDAITDYATRSTQLPKMEYLALSLIITKEGPVFYSSAGAHRTAAAKLRNEPLRFSSLQIFDAR